MILKNYILIISLIYFSSFILHFLSFLNLPSSNLEKNVYFTEPCQSFLQVRIAY